MEAAGYDPDAIGADPERLGRIGAFVELHVEQGRALDLSGDQVGIASAIWPHGRWRFDFRGEANHAGTTRLVDRRDPMLSYAETVLAARREAELAGAVATFGKIAVEPNGVNAIPSLVRGWLDSRAADQESLDQVVGGVERAAREYAAAHGVDLDVVRESFTPVVEFDHALRDELARVLGKDTGLTVPVLGTGAGHDAGILSGSIPTAMLFVRNPTGVSHSPAEFAAEDDCVAGVTRTRRRTGRAGLQVTHADVLAGARLARHPRRAGRGRWRWRTAASPPSARTSPTPPPGAEILRGLTLPGLANAHSHAFHRALRGTVQVGSGTFWTWREVMYSVADTADPGDLPRTRPRGVRRDGAGRDHEPSASSTTSTTPPAAPPTPTPTRWAKRSSRPPPTPASASPSSTPPISRPES